jgi:DNA-binding PadR family transcriptional regulator
VRIRSAVNWAVLGLVIERPSYGYELFHRLGRRYEGVLAPPISQIYAALDALERAALIEPLPEEQLASIALEEPARPRARRQPKVHYRATASGARAFRAWIAERMRDDPQHVELLRRLAAAAGAGFEQIGVMHELVDHYERCCVEEASRMPLARARNGAPAAAGGELLERLMLAARRGLLDAQFAWIDYARKEIDAFARARSEPDDEPSHA